MFSLICAWINGWVNNRDAGDLRHHRTHYDVTVMMLAKCRLFTGWTLRFIPIAIWHFGLVLLILIGNLSGCLVQINIAMSGDRHAVLWEAVLTDFCMKKKKNFHGAFILSPNIAATFRTYNAIWFLTIPIATVSQILRSTRAIEQKFGHFSFGWCIVGYITGALWNLWDWSVHQDRERP